MAISTTHVGPLFFTKGGSSVSQAGIKKAHRGSVLLVKMPYRNKTVVKVKGVKDEVVAKLGW